jgi:4-diphosphocytidyl-2-C-methyl-D-erythritol kinase
VTNNKLVLPSPAKINLFLHINGRRADGYHLLQTQFQFLDYGDTLSFELTQDRLISLNCNLPELQSDDNLIVQSARLLQSKYAPNKGIRIHLEKCLPMGGGVGGGSSNAATTMLALNHLWKLELSSAKLQQLGLGLGADIPVFIRGESVFAQGIGEVFTPSKPRQHWYLIAKPNCHVSTATIFTHFDLPRDTPTIEAKDYKFDQSRNDCEVLVKKLYPEVANTIDRLIEYAPTRLTGTGACVFSLFDNKQSAEKAMSYLPKGVSGFVAYGLNVSPTLSALQQIYGSKN